MQLYKGDAAKMESGMMKNAMESSEDHVGSYGTYVLVWAALMLLLAATIAVARMDITRYSILLNLFIATVKAGLVLFFFMHLKYERWFLKAVLFMVLATLAALIALFFSDVWYR